MTPEEGKKPGAAERLGLIPAGELKCIWMVAGVLSYKLCNRAFQCDSCPLDRVLQTMDDHGGPAASQGVRLLFSDSD